MPINIPTAEKVRKSKESCNVLLSKVNLSTKDTEMCQWSYTCRHNSLYFPSFLIEAKLGEQSNIANCIPLKVDNFKIVKTYCLNNPGESHFCYCISRKKSLATCTINNSLSICHAQSVSTLSLIYIIH